MNKYLIVGGVAGGATTAARLRRNDENCEIILFERGEYVSYANCGLPYYIGNVIKNREDLLLQTPESFKRRFNIDVRVGNEVVGINRESKTVTVKNYVTNTEYVESYSKLVLSPGAEPVKPPIEGIESPLLFTLRNVNDTDKIKSYIDINKPKNVVVVGGGFVGLEMVENLSNIGLNITLVEAGKQVMAFLDSEMASQIHTELKTNKVNLYLNDAVSKFKTIDNKIIVSLASGNTIESDLVIFSIGVKPEIKLAKDFGITIGERGGIQVDKHLLTNDPNIYAVGDAIEFKNPITNKSALTFLAGPANKQGRIVANNIAFGNLHEYKGSISTAVAKVFEITVASTGVSEKVLKSENIPYQTASIHIGSHAGYYPNASRISLKITFSPEGKLYGGQAIGEKGIDKRIDLIATIIKGGGTIYDLQEIEHAYAPPFSSAKDPVNVIGFVAGNTINKSMKIINREDIVKRDINSTFLVDVRTPIEFSTGTIEGAINIEIDEIRNNLAQFPKDKKIYIFCAVGLRGYNACRILHQNGFDVYNLSGGITTYNNSVI